MSIPYYYGHLSRPVAAPIPLYIALTGGAANDNAGTDSRDAIAGWWHGATGGLERQQFVNFNRNSLDWGGGLGFTPADYEVRATWVGSTLEGDSSALNTWLNAAFNYKWRLRVLNGNVGVKSGTLTLSIRNATTEAILASDDYTIDVERNT